MMGSPHPPIQTLGQWFPTPKLEPGSKGNQGCCIQSFGLPQLEYTAPIWNLHHQTEINRIKKVQRTAACWSCRRWHNQSLQWPELQERRQQASLTFFYKIHNNIVLADKNRYLSEAGGNRSTRSHPFQYHHPNAFIWTG